MLGCTLKQHENEGLRSEGRRMRSGGVADGGGEVDGGQIYRGPQLSLDLRPGPQPPGQPFTPTLTARRGCVLRPGGGSQPGCPHTASLPGLPCWSRGQASTASARNTGSIAGPETKTLHAARRQHLGAHY